MTTSGQYWSPVVMSWKSFKNDNLRGVYVSTFSSWPLMTSTGRKWLFDVNTILNLFYLYSCTENNFFAKMTTSGQYWSPVVMSWKYFENDDFWWVYVGTFSSWPLLTSTGRMWFLDKKTWLKYHTTLSLYKLKIFGQSGHFRSPVVISGHEVKALEKWFLKMGICVYFHAWPLMTTDGWKWPLWPL